MLAAKGDSVVELVKAGANLDLQNNVQTILTLYDNQCLSKCFALPFFCVSVVLSLLDCSFSNRMETQH